MRGNENKLELYLKLLQYIHLSCLSFYISYERPNTNNNQLRFLFTWRPQMQEQELKIILPSYPTINHVNLPYLSYLTN